MENMDFLPPTAPASFSRARLTRPIVKRVEQSTDRILQSVYRILAATMPDFQHATEQFHSVTIPVQLHKSKALYFPPRVLGELVKSIRGSSSLVAIVLITASS